VDRGSSAPDGLRSRDLRLDRARSVGLNLTAWSRRGAFVLLSKVHGPGSS